VGDVGAVAVPPLADVPAAPADAPAPVVDALPPLPGVGGDRFRGGDRGLLVAVIGFLGFVVARGGLVGDLGSTYEFGLREDVGLVGLVVAVFRDLGGDRGFVAPALGGDEGGVLAFTLVLEVRIFGTESVVCLFFDLGVIPPPAPP
jgi:hypothetical protein